MAQHDGVIDNGTGNAVRTDINNALAAINSNNSGASDPSTTYAYQFYADTGDNTLKIRNAANDGFVNVSAVGGIGSVNLGLAALTGATFTGNVDFNDDVKIRLGTGDDLELYHDGNSVISSSDGYLKITSTTGALYLQSDNTIHLTSNNAGETFAKFIDDGAVELYYE